MRIHCDWRYYYTYDSNRDLDGERKGDLDCEVEGDLVLDDLTIDPFVDDAWSDDTGG